MAQVGDVPVISPDGNRDDNQDQNQDPDQVPNKATNQVPNQNLLPLNPFLPNAWIVPEAPLRPQLNWSHFKPKFAGKPDKDVEVHLHRMNDWMDTHEFPDQVRVQRFCLTLIGEARVWYESLRPINAYWAGLQNFFRQQYSKIGNTREQLFHMWRSFHFDENAETIDAYVNSIRQVANPYRIPRTTDIRSI